MLSPAPARPGEAGEVAQTRIELCQHRLGGFTAPASVACISTLRAEMGASGGRSGLRPGQQGVPSARSLCRSLSAGRWSPARRGSAAPAAPWRPCGRDPLVVGAPDLEQRAGVGNIGAAKARVVAVAHGGRLG
jgi:hypothetical protein